MPLIKLDKAQIKLLLLRYKENDILWNPNHPKHREMELKNRIWEDIANQFSTTPIEVKKLIKTCTANYYAERKKLANCEIAQPSLFYYYIFEAIKELMMGSKTPNNEDGSSETLSPVLVSSSTSIKSRRRLEDRDDSSNQMAKKPKISAPSKNSVPRKPVPGTTTTTKKPVPAKHVPNNNDEPLVQENSDLNVKPSYIVDPLPMRDEVLESLDLVTGRIHDIIKESKASCSERSEVKFVPPKIVNKTQEPERQKELCPDLDLKFKKLSPSPKCFTTRTQSNQSKNLQQFLPKESSSLSNKKNVSGCSSDTDMFSYIARVWAEKLSSLTSCQRLLAEKAINDIMFQAETGSLNLDLVEQISTNSLTINDIIQESSI